MTTWLTLLAGIAVVVGGIIRLRLHAFVALILGALLVAMLTPAAKVERAELAGRTVAVRAMGDDNRLELAKVIEPAGDYVLLLDRGPERPLAELSGIRGLRAVATGDPSAATGTDDTPSVYEFEASTDVLPVMPGSAGSIRLVSSSVLKAARVSSQTPAMDRVTSAFGSTCGKLAIRIAAASIIGRCLLESGAADRIVRASLSLFTERFAPLAFAVAGFVLAIPVFFDTVFLLMIPLGKSMYRRTGRNYLLLVLSIVIGATMAHSLVPPTPGPLLIAREFGLPLLQMVIGGCIVGGIGALGGLLFAMMLNRRFEVPLRDDETGGRAVSPADEQLPSLAESLLPIVVPILLIALGTQVELVTAWSVSAPEEIRRLVNGTVTTLCDSNMALIVGAVLAMMTLKRFRALTAAQFQKSMGIAVTAAGTIILVTSAGSAFGRMLQQTSVAELLAGMPGSSPVGIVLAAFLVTALVRTAQGSATVAMITGAGVIAPIIASGAVPVHPLYVALAVGCGSKPFSWMNDSGFLVITRTSGMTDAEGLRYATPTIAIAAVVGLAVILVGVLWFPTLPDLLPS